MMERKQVGILVFDDIEVLDFCGPFEVFSTVRIDETMRRTEPSPFDVCLVAETTERVLASGGLKVLPDHDLASCPPLDILVVPGGWGTRREMDNPRLLEWIAQRAAQVEIIASVCTGALLLGRAGLLDNRRATTHWRSLDWMQQLFPKTVVERELHVVEDGNVFTSAGISAGIDLSLRIVARYHGDAVARATAKHMEYPYPGHDERRVELP